MRVAESPTGGSAGSPSGNLQWGRNMRVAESGRARYDEFTGEPSMGPQHESCGKAAAANTASLILVLQWGRNMRVAERLAA